MATRTPACPPPPPPSPKKNKPDRAPVILEWYERAPTVHSEDMQHHGRTTPN